MKKLIKTISCSLPFFLGLIFGGCNKSNTPISPAINELSDTNFIHHNHDSLIYEHVNNLPNGTELSFGFLVDNEPYFVGVSRLNDTLVVVTNEESIFEIGSISKVFTSTLLANTIVNSDLDMDSAINPYLDFQLADSIEISFKELANHTAGLPRMPPNILLSLLFNPSNPYKNYDHTKLEKYLTEKLELHYEQGQVSKYSNIGSTILGFTLSEITGENYESMLQKNIFKPYGMPFSTTKRESLDPGSLVKGLDEEGLPTPNWDLNAFTPAGGILSNVKDLSSFASAQFDTSNYALNLTREVTFSDTTHIEVGLGWLIINTKSGDRWHWHNGGTGGYKSSMAIDIEKKNAVIVLSNVSGLSPKAFQMDDLCFDLMKSLSDF